jgi:hypothetical protein
MARQIEKSQNIEQSIKNRMTDFKFIPHKTPDCPSLLGFISYYCDYTGTESGSIGIHTDGKEYWVRWPYTKKDFYANLPRFDVVKKAYINVFIEIMDEAMGKTKPAMPAPIVKDRITVTREEPRGCTNTCPCYKRK